MQSVMERMKAAEKQLHQDYERSYQTKDDGGKFTNLFVSQLPFPRLKIKNGEWIVDQLPYFCGANDPNNPPGTLVSFLDIWAHTYIGPNKDSYLCMAKFANTKDHRCAVCEEIAWLRNNDDNMDDDDLYQMGAKRKAVYYMVCYNQGEEQKGPQIAEVSYVLLQKALIEQSKQPSSMAGQVGEYIYYSHPINGQRIFFRHTGAKRLTRIGGVKFFPRPAPIPAEYFEKINQYPLDSLLVFPDYDSVKRTLIQYRNMGKEEEPSTSATPQSAAAMAGMQTAAQYSNPCPANQEFGVSFGTITQCLECVVKDECIKEKMKKLQEGMAASAGRKIPKDEPPAQTAMGMPVQPLSMDDEIPF